MPTGDVTSIFRAVFAALLLAAPAAADLTYYGPHRTEALAVYAQLPERGKSLPCLAWELPPGSDLNRRVLGRDWSGVYDEKAGGFLLDWGEGGITLAHEWAHHVYHRALTDAERSRWAEWWRGHRDLLPRAYSRTNADEGFADSYAGVYYPAGIEWRHRADVAPILREILGR